jgi:DNA-binding LytR/AlgR family response regulator
MSLAVPPEKKRILGREQMSDRFHVLHIEDDELDALNVQRFVRATDLVSGFNYATDGVEALELLHLPVVVLSTSEDEEDLGAAYALNVAGYLVKPLSVDRLRSTLGAFVRYWSAQELL